MATGFLGRIWPRKTPLPAPAVEVDIAAIRAEAEASILQKAEAVALARFSGVVEEVLTRAQASSLPYAFANA